MGTLGWAADMSTWPNELAQCSTRASQLCWDTGHIWPDEITPQASPHGTWGRSARAGSCVLYSTILYRMDMSCLPIARLGSSGLGLKFALIIPVLHPFCEQKLSNRSLNSPVTSFNSASTDNSLQHLRLTKYLAIFVKSLELLFCWSSLASWYYVLLLLHRAYHVPWGAVNATAWSTSAHHSASLTGDTITEPDVQPRSPLVGHSPANCEGAQRPRSYCLPEGIEHLEWQLKICVRFSLYNLDPLCRLLENLQSPKCFL